MVALSSSISLLRVLTGVGVGGVPSYWSLVYAQLQVQEANEWHGMTDGIILFIEQGLGGGTLVVLASSWRLDLSVPTCFMGFPSTITGDGCSTFSTPTRALVDSLLLVLPPFVDTEYAVSLLSVDDGEVIRLALDLDRLCRAASLRLFLCWGTLEGMGLTEAAFEL
jgi:hypothetical protein